METGRVAGRVTTHKTALLTGALTLPLLVLCLYLLGTRSIREFSAWSDFTALGVALVSGAACLWKVLPSNGWRPLFILLYLVAGTLALALFSLVFVCGVFGDCP
jgi:hypothetical protein